MYHYGNSNEDSRLEGVKKETKTKKLNVGEHNNKPSAIYGKAQSDMVTNLMTYFIELDSTVAETLFNNPTNTIAFYQSLCDLEQAIVLRLVFMKQPVSERLIRLWMNSSSENLVKKTMASLKSKHIILHKPPDQTSKSADVWQYLLHNTFQATLQSFLLGKPIITPNLLQSWQQTHHTVSPPSWDTLQKHSSTRWHTLLECMMNDDEENENSTQHQVTHLCEDLLNVLTRKSLIPADRPQKSKGMSREGFSWLLKDLQSQICSLVIELLLIIDGGTLTNFASNSKLPTKNTNREQAATAVVEIITLILQLSQSLIGQPYSSHSLTESQKRFLLMALDLGLIWTPNPSLDTYVVAPYSALLAPHTKEAAKLSILVSTKHSRLLDKQISSPTTLSLHTQTNLDHYIHPDVMAMRKKTETLESSSSLPDKQPEPTTGLDAHILVQSNFKLYAYTTSSLQASILGHLCELQAKTSNLIVGLLSRDSILAAYKTGISAEQIIRFLSTHAHPALRDRKARTGKEILPDNVIRQLKMWEQERRRLKLQPALIFKNWDSPILYQRCVRYALSKGFELYHNPWPSNVASDDYKEWQSKEKFLAISEDAKDEMVREIRETRDQLLAS